MDSYENASGPSAAGARERGIRSSVGAPITVEGHVWGVIIAASTRAGPAPPGAETRLAGFAELAGTTIANAQARLELRSYAAEQAALRRVATLVAQGEPPAVLFAAVAKEVGALFSTDMVGILRFGPGGAATLMGRHGMQHEPGARGKLPAHTAAASVQQTGHAARVDVDGTTALDQSAVSAPIVVNGQLWGVIGVAGHERLPPDAEQRVAGFTELVATAIANAEAQSQLTASRARIVATADETRRRIERNLHDGAQQRLVTLTLQLRTAQAAVPAGLDGLAAELGRVAAGLSGTLDDLREYARRIHPAILSKRGLVPALRALVRRSPVPVALDLRAAERLPERIEITAYYVVSEALTNAAKHDNATAVRVAVEAAGRVVRLSVSDDGAGGVDPAHGPGVVSLRDRVEAVGGTLIVQSRPGEGTRLIAELPAVSGPQDPG
jgi:signal transduction histidine kinase